MQADANFMKPVETDDLACARATDFDLEHFLPYRLSVLTNTISEGLARRYRDLQPLSVTEWRILAVLGRFPGLVASEVCDRTAMDKVAISRGVRSLMEKGMLDRQQDRSDRRRQRLFISPERGERVLQKVVPVALQYERQLVESLDDGELEALSRIMQKLIRQSEALDADHRRTSNPLAGTQA
jgi:DNA-binding MarR family transcriptional regulator